MLNAVVNITAALASDICAFGDYLSSPSVAFAEARRPREKTIHLLLVGHRRFPKMFFASIAST